MAMKEAVVRFTGIDNLSSVANRAASSVERSAARMARSAGVAANRSAAEWQRMGRGMDLAGRSMAQFGTVSAAAMTAGIAGTVKVASSFEEALAGVAKVTNLTDKEMLDMDKTIQGMSKRIPSTYEEIAKGMEVAGRLGIEGADNMVKFTETIMQLGVATEMETEAAADSLARLMNIFGTSQGDVDRLGSTLVQLGNNLATSEGEILNLTLRLAGSASQLGMTEAETMGLAGAMSALGIRAEMGKQFCPVTEKSVA